MSSSAIVIGAGIVGLATARALAVRGYRVSVFEKNERQIGASIRNFGMIWPVGQPDGEMFERALLSRAIWKEICDEAAIWHSETGSLHLAYQPDEMQVMEDYVKKGRSDGKAALISKEQALRLSPVARPDGLLGALWSPTEMIVEAREAIRKVADYLSEKYNVTFHYNTAITLIDHPVVYSGKRSWSADQVFVSSGSDFETLYPEIFLSLPITKCKLQMMRFGAQPDSLKIGPSLCGSLSMIHYKAFASLPSLPLLRERYQKDYPEQIQWGIHVMVSQNAAGELTIGDSHEYGLAHDPFIKTFINEMIIEYLASFTTFKNYQITQSWTGEYSKMIDGQTAIILSPQDGVTIINGLGGAGMTLSFGLTEQYISAHY